MRATLFIPCQVPQGAPVRGLQCERGEVSMGALCAAAIVLGIELPDVRTICIDPAAGIIAYLGNELQELAGQRNVAAEQVLNRLLPGAPFFGVSSSQQCEGMGWYGPVLLVERTERSEHLVLERQQD